jgi:hypothetical protein
VSVEQAREVLPELVEWFKLTNRWHRPLLQKVQATGKGSDGLPEDRAQEMAAKAVRLITAEHKRRLRIERSRPNMQLVEELRSGVWREYGVDLRNDAVMVARRRADGRYIAVVPERSDENVFAAVIEWGTRRQDGAVDFYRESFTTGWRHGGSRWTSTWRDLELQASLSGDPWPDGALVLWRDRPLIDGLRVRFQEYARAVAPRESLSQRSFELRRSIEAAWEAAWWEQQRQAFVAEYGKPELWDGQRKVIEDRMSRKFERLEAPVDGLSDVIRAFVERGRGDDLWGRTVGDVLNEAIGLGWAELEPEEGQLDASLLPLSFPQPPQADDEEGGWGPSETDEEFDVEGTIAVAGELEAGS